MPQSAPVVNIPTFQYTLITPAILNPTVRVPPVPINPSPMVVGTPVDTAIPVPIPPPAYGINMRNPKFIPPPNATAAEKLEYQRQAERAKQKRYRDKTKSFIEIGKLPTINERIKRVVTLTYPNIHEQIDEIQFNNAINQFVTTLFMPPHPPQY